MIVLLPGETAYTYLGDKLTAPELVNRPCRSVIREDGRCIRGRNGSMLVMFDKETAPRVVLARRLRKLYQQPRE